jgi:uncharacterized repeat protein (TIGR03803 family)
MAPHPVVTTPIARLNTKAAASSLRSTPTARNISCTASSRLREVYPIAGLLLDAAGNLYGTTSGFATYNWGSIFKLDKKRTFTKLYDFTGGTDGGFPFAGLTQDEAGNFYGTTYLGGLTGGCDGGQGCGVVFKLTP